MHNSHYTIGREHKRQRTILGAVFSERRMKCLLPVMHAVVQEVSHSRLLPVLDTDGYDVS
jgi:cytochrome P450